MQKSANLVELEQSCKISTCMYLQKSASIQPRTSSPKFGAQALLFTFTSLECLIDSPGPQLCLGREFADGRPFMGPPKALNDANGFVESVREDEVESFERPLTAGLSASLGTLKSQPSWGVRVI